MSSAPPPGHVDIRPSPAGDHAERTRILAPTEHETGTHSTSSAVGTPISRSTAGAGPEATAEGTPLDASFSAAIAKDGAFPTYVELPGSDRTLGTRRAVKVAGTIDGHPFTATLMPSGRGPHWLPLRAALCKEIGKPEAGEPVAVRLQQRFS